MATRVAPAKPDPKFNLLCQSVRNDIVAEKPPANYLFSAAGVVCWVRFPDGSKYSGYDSSMATKAYETAINAALVTRMVVRSEPPHG